MEELEDDALPFVLPEIKCRVPDGLVSANYLETYMSNICQCPYLPIDVSMYQYSPNFPIHDYPLCLRPYLPVDLSMYQYVPKFPIHENGLFCCRRFFRTHTATASSPLVSSSPVKLFILLLARSCRTLMVGRLR